MLERIKVAGKLELRDWRRGCCQGLYGNFIAWAGGGPAPPAVCTGLRQRLSNGLLWGSAGCSGADSAVTERFRL